jgi:hypothetical protein
MTPAGWFTTGHGIAGFRPSAGGPAMPVLTSEDWFLWAPPPAAGRIG